MSHRIRGQEIAVRITVDGQLKKGSFAKLVDCTVRPRQEITEDDFLGETESDLDFQHHGFDITMSIQNQDAEALELLSELVDLEASHKRHPQITVTLLYTYREPGVAGRAEVYHDAFIRISENGFKGRKERNTTEFEVKAKKRSLIAAA